MRRVRFSSGRLLLGTRNANPTARVIEKLVGNLERPCSMRSLRSAYVFAGHWRVQLPVKQPSRLWGFESLRTHRPVLRGGSYTDGVVVAPPPPNRMVWVRFLVSVPHAGQMLRQHPSLPTRLTGFNSPDLHSASRVSWYDSCLPSRSIGFDSRAWLSSCKGVLRGRKPKVSGLRTRPHMLS